MQTAIHIYQQKLEKVEKPEQENEELILMKQKYEKNLIEINEKFNSITNNIPGYLAVVNANTLKYEFVNNIFV